MEKLLKVGFTINHKKLFLFSFLPAMAYWYLEAHYPLRIAVAGGLALAVLEISFEYIFVKHIHAISKFNFFLLAFLGTLSLLGDEGIWFKLQPCFTGLGIGGYLFYRSFKGHSLMLEMMQGMDQRIPFPEIIDAMEKHIATFFLCYGTFMGVIAWQGSTDQWIFYKTLGFYGIFLVFFLIEVIYIRSKMQKILSLQQKQKIFKNF